MFDFETANGPSRFPGVFRSAFNFSFKNLFIIIFFRIETSQSVPFCFNKTFDNFIVNREEIKL